MKWLPLILLTVFLTPVSRGEDQPKPGNEGHGGSGILVDTLLDEMKFADDEAVELFDTLEYDKEFTPAELDEFAQHIKPKLDAIKRVLPRTGDYLEKIFSRGINPRWYLVRYKLKKVSDSSDHTNLIVTFEHVQIALNDGRKVQIQEAFWNKLEPRSRARLLMHEALRSAIGIHFPQPTNPVKSIASLLTHKNLSQFNREDLAKELLSELEVESTLKQSHFYKLIEVDANIRQMRLAGWLDLSVLADGLTPNSCYYETDQCVFQDKVRHLKWTRLAPEESLNARKTLKDAEISCRKMNQWGGETDWRLPNFSELQDVMKRLSELAKSLPAFGPVQSLLWSSSVPLTDPWNPLGITNPEAHTGGWAFSLATGDFRPANPAAELGWLCVKNPLSQWRVLSKNKNNEIDTKCSHDKEECAFQFSDQLIWSEASPNYTPKYLGEMRKGDLGFVARPTAISNCKNLNWLGLSGWRTPSYSEMKHASENGMFTLALSNENFGSLTGHFWINDSAPSKRATKAFDPLIDESHDSISSTGTARFICVHDPVPLK